MTTQPKPPEGYESWLDYVLAYYEPEEGAADIAHARAELAELRAKLDARTSDLKLVEEAFDDFKSERQRVLDEACPSDELHCTCVPTLRAEIERMRGTITDQDREIERLRVLIHKLEAALRGEEKP